MTQWKQHMCVCIYGYIAVEAQIKLGKNIHQIDPGRGEAYSSTKMRISCCVICGSPVSRLFHVGSLFHE